MLYPDKIFFMEPPGQALMLIGGVWGWLAGSGLTDCDALMLHQELVFHQCVLSIEKLRSPQYTWGHLDINPSQQKETLEYSQINRFAVAKFRIGDGFKC